MAIQWMLRLIYLSIPIFIWSCGAGNNDKSISIAHTAPLLKDTLSYSYVDLKEVSPYFALHNDSIDTAFYAIRYPQFDVQKYNVMLKPYILIEGENTAQEAAENFIMAYNEFVEDEATRQLQFAWHRDIECTIAINTPLFFSLKNTLSEYTGGAHGNSYVFWTNFDVLKAEKIELPDILAENKHDELTQIAEKYFRKSESLLDTASLDSLYFFKEGKFQLNDNFGFTANHFILYYNEYEIKPYSEGTTEIRIPYEQIKDLLTIRGKQYLESINKN